MILIALTCTKKDFLTYEERLETSFKNFISFFGVEIFFLIVFQGDEENCFDASKTFLGSIPSEFYSFQKVPYCSVSRARNYAIKYSRENKFEYLIFHDSSLVYTRTYICWLKSHLNGDLLATNYIFTESRDFESDRSVGKAVSFDDFSDIFVCSYAFPMNKNFPCFDERFGPGNNSIYNSGEDFLFIRSFFKLNSDSRNYLRFDGVGILHPPRPKDYSKHLAYAEGQGKIHQIYLLEEKSLYALWRCFLFFGNSFIRLVFFKKNSLRILFLRLKGFFSNRVKV